MTPVIFSLSGYVPGVIPLKAQDLWRSCFLNDQLEFFENHAGFAAREGHPRFQVEFSTRERIAESLRICVTTILVEDVLLRAESYFGSGPNFDEICSCIDYLFDRIDGNSVYMLGINRFSGDLSRYILGGYITASLLGGLDASLDVLQDLLANPEAISIAGESEADLHVKLARKMIERGHEVLVDRRRS